MQKNRLNLRNVVAITICLVAMAMFASCEKNNEKIKDAESLIFKFQRVGGWIGLNENLSINADSTHYSISYYEFGTWAPKSYQTAIKTSEKLWNNLTKTFELETFTKIKDGVCRACVDGYDDTFTITQYTENYLIYNGDSDEHFKQMQDFFDSIFIESYFSAISFNLQVYFCFEYILT
jgi:hypothetical protein